jgi:glycerol-3-phosphate dehydrogenase
MQMTLDQLPANWDLVVVGGGITGAGVFREAVAQGVRTLLIEKHDFAWGTSSRSSKLVHGGLRYLRQGQIGLTRESVKEREWLLRKAPGLVTPIHFVMPLYQNGGPRRWEMKLGLTIYDLLAGRYQHKFLDVARTTGCLPHLRCAGLTGAYRFKDAQTDDARLVLRLIWDGVAAGGVASNYTQAVEILRNRKGDIEGLEVADSDTGATRTLRTRTVINATGVWAARLDPHTGRQLGMRPLRGSHLILPREVLPLDLAVSFMHPEDRRAVFVEPWEGVVLLGTTDLDHEGDLDAEPIITSDEVDYLLAFVQYYFPGAAINRQTCVGTLSGVRPVLRHGHRSPSAESREHAVRASKGLVTVTGGKLTTFRVLARDALRAAQAWLPGLKCPPAYPPFESVTINPPTHVAVSLWQTLCGRYGAIVARQLLQSEPALLQSIANTRWVWAELRHAVCHEGVRHLDDLLLRRVRVGLVRPREGPALLDRVQSMCTPHLPWDATRWQDERRRYEDICQRLSEPLRG